MASSLLHLSSSPSRLLRAPLARHTRRGANKRAPTIAPITTTITTTTFTSSFSSSSPPPSPSSSSSLSAAAAAQQILDHFHDKTTTLRQTLDGPQLQKLSLTLARPHLYHHHVLAAPPPDGTPLPPGYHLAYFAPAQLEAALGPDGTDRTFNAPHPFTRRMWAGGRLTWHPQNPLRVGQAVEERTRLVGATPKVSRRGGGDGGGGGRSEMVLVEVEKEFWGPDGLALVDRRSWVFRPPPPPPARPLARSDALVNGVVPDAVGRCSSVQDVEGASNFPQRHFCWSPVALFRFSALTFNAHMIHYNESWTGNVEGHPAVVVHGPLNLIGMLDYWRDVHAADGKQPSEITYRALSPLYAGDEYVVRTESTSDEGEGEGEDEAGRTWELAVVRGNKKCMQGTIRTVV